MLPVAPQLSSWLVLLIHISLCLLNSVITTGDKGVALEEIL